jgi:hypothetical protein
MHERHTSALRGLGDDLVAQDSAFEGMILCGCLTHCRRYFDQAAKVTELPSGQQLARVALKDYLGKVFFVERQIDADQIDRGYGYCSMADCQPRVTRYEAGTLVVDMVDAATNVLIWRGWAQGSLDGVLGNRDRLRRRIDDSVRQMFETLPQR